MDSMGLPFAEAWVSAVLTQGQDYCDRLDYSDPVPGVHPQTAWGEGGLNGGMVGRLHSPPLCPPNTHTHMQFIFIKHLLSAGYHSCPWG